MQLSQIKYIPVEMAEDVIVNLIWYLESIIHRSCSFSDGFYE
jgi:hypothetical protein